MQKIANSSFLMMISCLQCSGWRRKLSRAIERTPAESGLAEKIRAAFAVG
jgi:hypothetical protein